MSRSRFPFLLAFLTVIFVLPSRVLASGLGTYWYGFKKFWGEVFGSVGGVVLIALVVGVISLFIITRGKWRK
jgi:uncharacterized membrane protein